MTRGDVISFTEAEGKVFALYGLDVNSRFLDLRDPVKRARVLETGDGPPVLFVIGGGGSASMWAPLWSELHGFRAYAPDRPGFGLTDGVDYRGFTPQRFRQHAVSFLTSVLVARQKLGTT